MNEKELIENRRAAVSLSCGESSFKHLTRDTGSTFIVRFGQVVVCVWLNLGTVFLSGTVTVTHKTDLMSIAQELMAAELFMLNVREKFRVIDDEAKESPVS